MTGLIGYYSAQLRTSLVLQFQYRVAMAIWMIGLIIEPVIYLAVWTAVAESSGGTVGTFTAGDFAAYYILLLIVQHFTQIWHMWEYDYLIRQGILSGRMLRPIHPIHRDAAENMAYKVIMAPVAAAAVIVLILIFQPTVAITLEGVLGFIGALILAAWLAFMLGGRHGRLLDDAHHGDQPDVLCGDVLLLRPDRAAGTAARRAANRRQRPALPLDGLVSGGGLYGAAVRQ